MQGRMAKHRCREGLQSVPRRYSPAGTSYRNDLSLYSYRDETLAWPEARDSSKLNVQTAM